MDEYTSEDDGADRVARCQVGSTLVLYPLEDIEYTLVLLETFFKSGPKVSYKNIQTFLFFAKSKQSNNCFKFGPKRFLIFW